MKKAVMCIVQKQSQAESIVAQLQSTGFPSSDISVLFPNTNGMTDFAHIKAPEGAVAGARTGGLLGGTLGFLAGIGVLSIPGLGPIVAAGPLLATLSGVTAGARVGGISGGLIGIGIPEIDAKRYEGKIMGGNVLISVHAETNEEVRRAEGLFKAAQAEDICSTTEAKVPKGEEADRAV